MAYAFENSDVEWFQKVTRKHVSLRAHPIIRQVNLLNYTGSPDVKCDHRAAALKLPTGTLVGSTACGIIVPLAGAGAGGESQSEDRSPMFVYFPKTAYRLFLAGLLVASVLGLASLLPAAAQEPDKGIGEATLQLWPEYDDPGLLVIYSGEFTDTLQFPQEVAFPLPEGARGIQATSRESDGRLMTQEWQIVAGLSHRVLPGPAAVRRSAPDQLHLRNPLCGRFPDRQGPKSGKGNRLLADTAAGCLDCR
jgi:hypothetical protein